MTTLPPRADIAEHIITSERYFSYVSARVLEIGGDRWDASAKGMAERGAEHVTTINISPAWPENERVSDVLTKRKVDANALSASFEPGEFDVCYGIAVLEHIPRSWLMLEEIGKLLKPGGWAYLHGGPIWTSAKGHHLFTRFLGEWYRFSDKACPIHNWEHLQYCEAQLSERIQGRGVEPTIAAHLAHWVFTTQEQNRYGFGRLKRIFESAGFEVVARHDNVFKGPDEHQLRLIRQGPWGDEEGFDVMGTTFVLRKG